MSHGARVAIVLFALLAVEAEGKEIFVSTTGSDGNSGATSLLALKTIAAATAKAEPGDVIQILPGRYEQSIAPTRSGVPGKPIAYKRFGSSPVVLTHTYTEGLRAAIDLYQVSHIVVDGIDVDGVKPGPDAKVLHFAHIKDASQVVIRNCNFRYSNGYFGVYVGGASSYVTIEDCSIDWTGLYNNGNTGNSDFGDLVAFDRSVHHVLVQRNRFKHGPHDVIVMKGQYGIIQDNVFSNDYSDVYGGDVGGRVGAMVGANNVYQRNLFTKSGRSSDAPWNSFTKFEGESNIARLNVFAYGHQEALQSDAAQWSPVAHNNRAYNNTFYRLGASAWRNCWFDGGQKIGNNKFINNLVVDSRMNPVKGSLDNDVTIAVTGAGAGDLAGNQVFSNIFSPAGGKAPIILVYGGANDVDLQTAESKYPQNFGRNTWKRPLFVSSNPQVLQDFDLQSGSPGVDEGMFVTTVVRSGTSDRVQVGDSKFFIDGFGLIPGDVIKLQGTSTTARVVAIDHSTNTLQLSQSLTFRAGQGIALDYSGSAPDIGARERGGSAVVGAPAPPSGLSVQ